jgi:NADPH:quinone reductase-like Zn-dependent oxidoreductase
MAAETHRRIVVRQRGGPDVLAVTEEPLPEPAPGQVRVRTLAAGISGMDLMVRARRFPGFPSLPFTPGVDVVGVVEQVGDGVTTLQPRQTIAALLGGEGGYAEAVCVAAEKAVPVPDGADPAKAVCLVANYVTAWSMLHRAAKVRSGEQVLVHGAAGGVGTALLEVGRLAGLQVYGTASASNHELVRSLGATPIDYHTEDVVRRIRELTCDGVDVVFDPIGGGRQLWRSYRALRPGGRLVWFGVAGTARDGIGVIPASLVVRLVLSLLPDGKAAPMPPDSGQPTDWYRETLALLLDHLAAGKIDPVIAGRFPLPDAATAHRFLEQEHHAGRAVLVTDDT